MRVSVSDGNGIEFEVRRGSAGLPRLVLLHSLGLDRSVWADVLAALGGSVQVLTLDCRGHGQSSKPPGPYVLERFADDLAEVFDAISWEGAFVAGMSMGGCVALQFAAEYPERVFGLGLIDTTAWYGPNAAKDWDERARKAKKDGIRSLVEFQQTRWFGDAFRAANPDVVARTVDTFVRNGFRTGLLAYAETCRMLGTFDLRPALAGIGVPTEIVVGEEDYATPPEMARLMEKQLPHAHLEVIPGARHLTAIEVPDKIAAMLRLLIARGSAVTGLR